MPDWLRGKRLVLRVLCDHAVAVLVVQTLIFTFEITLSTQLAMELPFRTKIYYRCKDSCSSEVYCNCNQ